MAKYSSKPTTIALSAADLAARFSDFTVMQDKLNELPEEERQRIGEVSFTPDSIVITTPQVGVITLRATERTPERIVLTAENSPVPMNISVDIEPIDDASSNVTGTMDVDIPMMLRPLVGPALQKAVDQFGNLFAKLA